MYPILPSVQRYSRPPHARIWKPPSARWTRWYGLLKIRTTPAVPGTLRDSLVLLGLVLEQPTDLHPTEIMTDTGAYSDVVFGLFWLLGYRFCPRLADISGARYWRIDRRADYGVLNKVARHRINPKNPTAMRRLSAARRIAETGCGPRHINYENLPGSVIIQRNWRRP